MAGIIAPHCLVPPSHSFVDRLGRRAEEIRQQGGIPLLSSERFAGNPMSGGHDSKLIAERLKAIFDAAYMDCKIDSDGDLYVKGGACGVYIYIAKDPGLLRME